LGATAIFTIRIDDPSGPDTVWSIQVASDPTNQSPGDLIDDINDQENTGDDETGGKSTETPPKTEDRKDDEKRKSRKRIEKKDGKKERKIEFKPLPDDPSIYKVDGLEILTRKEVVTRLIRKHADFIGKFKDELKGDLKPTPEETAEMEKEKEERDRLNLEVANLKEQRSKYRSRNKILSKEFIELIEMQEQFKSKKTDITVHTRYWKDLEWKLETEAIDSETERRLMDDIRSTVDQIRNIADGYTPDEVKTRLIVIDREIKENLEKIESYHHQMLEIVNESQKHHEIYLTISKKIKEMEGRKGWLTRRIALHEEMKKFWEGQMGTAGNLDEEEGKRSIEMIRDDLLKLSDEKNPPRKQKDPKSIKNRSEEGEKEETQKSKRIRKQKEAKEPRSEEAESGDAKSEGGTEDGEDKPDEPGGSEVKNDEKSVEGSKSGEEIPDQAGESPSGEVVP
ncbi:MAG: hypothetical protein ACMUIG_03325, partial [Thermoplasmatota archaeon]